jgi:hypothetical protein
MIKYITPFLIASSVALTSCAQLPKTQSTPQTNSGNTTTTNSKKLSTGLDTQKSPSSSTSSTSSNSSSQNGIPGLSNDQVVSGLKEALSLGAQKSADKLSLADGFFKDMAVKILMPQEVKDVESKMRQLGMGSMVDNAILSMNRAAEMAAKDAAPIFIGAIKGMSFTDATSILTGPNDAATQYLKKTTSPQLTTKFTPVIKTALEKTDATKYWNDVFTNYNKIPFVKKVNPDLTGYVTQKALDGLFYTVALEEAKIRKDPAGTASSIINTVFGSVLKH